MNTLNEAFRELNKSRRVAINESRKFTIKTKDGKTTVIDKAWLDYRINGYNFVKDILDEKITDEDCGNYYYIEYNFEEYPPVDAIEKLIYKALRNRLGLDKLGESVSERDDIDADADDKKERAEKELRKKDDDADSIRDERKDSAKKKFEKDLDDIDADRDDKFENKRLSESEEPEGIRKLKRMLTLNIRNEAMNEESAATELKKDQEWIDYDEKHDHKISKTTQRDIEDQGLQIEKDQYGDYEVTAGHYE